MIKHYGKGFPWNCSYCNKEIFTLVSWNEHCLNCEERQKKVIELNNIKPKYDDREVEL